MSCNNVQILNFNHNIVEVGPDNKIVITDQVKCNSITIPQPVTNILQINSPGPQGLQGPVAFPYTGNAIISGSLVITGSLTISGSNTFTNIGPAIFIGNQTITGSLIVTGSATITGSLNTSGSITSDNLILRGNLTVSGSTTIGDSTTDTITLNANTINLGSGTGTLNIDSNTLYVDGANNRVGIGTTSPAMSFDVNGGGSFTSPLRIGGGGYISNAYNLQINSNSSTDTPIRIQGGYGTIQIEKDSSSTSAVAIGLSKPGVSIGDDYVLSLYKSTGGGWIERMRFTQAGNLLITGSTTSTLGFTGSLQGTSSYAITASYAMNGGGGSSFPYTGNAIISGSLGITGSLQLSGSSLKIDIPSKVNGYVLTTDAAGNATWQSAGAGAAFPYNGNAVITGSLLVSGSTGGLILTGSFSQNASTSSFGGLVGIGNTSPDARLHIGTSTSFLKVIPQWYGSTAVWLDMSIDGPTAIGHGGAGANVWIGYAAGSGQYFTNAAAGDIVYRNGGGKLLFGNTGGDAGMALSGDKLGIGTVNPSYKLEVAGDINYTGTLYQNGTPYTASNATSASYALTASYAATYSFVNVQVQPYISSSNVDGPYGFNSVLTASYAVNSTTAATVFPYTGNAGITGSLSVSEHLEVYSGSVVPYYTVTGIDLSAATYDITGSGIFEITNPNGSITFPDPSTHDGQTIFVINTDSSKGVNIDNTNTYAPYTAGTNTQLPSIDPEDMWNFVSIGGKWRGMTSFK